MINMYIKDNNKIIFLSILSLFIFINTIYFYLNFYSLIAVHDYAFNELFINYQSGLIRRGLLGEIFWHLNNITLIKPNYFFSTLFFILYLIQAYIFFQISKKFLVFKLFFIIIIFSPALLLFHIYDPNMYFIKDIFIKLSIILHGYFFLKSVNKTNQRQSYLFYLKFILMPLLFIIILIHEYQFFYIGIHFLVSLAVAKNNTDVRNIIKIYLFLLIPFLFVIIFFGDQSQFYNLSQILKKFDVNLNPHLGGGVIKYLGAFYKWHFFYFSYRDFLNLFFSFILSILVFYTFFKYLLNKKVIDNYSKYQRYFLIYFLPCLIPVFLTTDHGRNLSFIAIHLVVYFLTLKLNALKLNKIKIDLNENIYQKVVFVTFVFFYVFMWKLDQFAGFGLQGIPNDIFQSSLFAEFTKFIKYLYVFVDKTIIQLPQIKL